MGGIGGVYVLPRIESGAYSAYPAPMSQRDLHDVVHAQILVVDDEVEHADTMAEALRRMGHVCTIVTSAAKAEEAQVEALAHGSGAASAKRKESRG